MLSVTRPILCLAAVLTLFAESFEVASVKPAVTPAMEPMFCIVPCTPGERLTVTGTRVDIRYMSLHRLIYTAWRVKPHQVSGPEWMKTQRFDILAKLPDGAAKDRVPEMLQALLADRFKLVVHHETKEQPVIALVVGKGGSKLQEAAATVDLPTSSKPASQPLYTPQGDAQMADNGDLVVTGSPFGPMRGGRGAPGTGFKMEFLQLTMQGLAELMTPHVDHPVIDMTDLKGAYVFSWVTRPPGEDGGPGRKGGARGGEPVAAVRSPDDVTPHTNPMAEALFAAVAKAGLKLEPRKAPVDTIVVDHLEKSPTEN